MEMKITRRAILNVGTVVGGLAVGGSILEAANIMSATKTATALPWPWKEIKPADIQERAYQSTWANASGHKLMTTEHFERCNRLVADVAMQAVTMLNEYSSGKVVYKEKLNSFSQGCQSCHGPGKAKANVASGMTCDTCHTNPH
jgi:DnaJ-class molecular chaperone